MTLTKSSADFRTEIDSAKAEIATIESELSNLENEVDQKIRSDVRGEKSYSQSARAADQQRISNLKYRRDELKSMIPHLTEAASDATANEARLEADTIEAEQVGLEEEAAELLERLIGFFEEYCATDQEMLATFQKWQSLENRRRGILGRRSSERRFPAVAIPFQGIEPLRLGGQRRAEYLRRMPGWVSTWRPGQSKN